MHACATSVQISLIEFVFSKMIMEIVMEKKKLFVKPEVEVVRFDGKDVITGSNDTYSSSGSYAIESIRNFFNISN